MKFSGKMKNQGFHLSLENIYFEKPHGDGGEGGGGFKWTPEPL